MRKTIFPLLSIVLLAISCQKDDICIEPVTPKLVIRFYDDEEPTEYKSVENLTVWADGYANLYNEATTDSIAIPLNLAEDFTVFHLKSDTSEDEITINYTRNEVFVSRSCGYKYDFKELNLSNISNNWIIGTEVTNSTVDNETEHIKIIH